MGYSQNYGHLVVFLVIDYITAPIIKGYQNGTPILETTHVVQGLPIS